MGLNFLRHFEKSQNLSFLMHFLRLCTTKNERLNVDNYTDTRMHLTNYAINKGSENFVKNNSKYIMYGKGSKRHLELLKNNIEL